MGVRGLSAWLREHSSDTANLSILQTGARVLIDGTGLAFHVLRAPLSWHCACDLPPPSWFGILCGYAELDATIQSFLLRLQRAGLEPVVYFDGRATRLKSATISRRRRGRADLFEAFQAACMDGRTVAA